MPVLGGANSALKLNSQFLITELMGAPPRAASRRYCESEFLKSQRLMETDARTFALRTALLLAVLAVSAAYFAVDSTSARAANLFASISGGLLIAAAIFFAEDVRQRIQRRDQTAASREARLEVVKALTAHAGAELVNLPGLVGLDIETLDTPRGLQRLWTAINAQADAAPPHLTMNAWDVVERFYTRLGEIFVPMLTALVQANDRHVLEPLLDVWALRREHLSQTHFIWPDRSSRSLTTMANLTDNAAQRAAYLHFCVRFLEAYSELLRAAEDIRSGRPSRR